MSHKNTGRRTFFGVSVGFLLLILVLMQVAESYGADPTALSFAITPILYVVFPVVVVSGILVLMGELKK